MYESISPRFLLIVAFLWTITFIVVGIEDGFINIALIPIGVAAIYNYVLAIFYTHKYNCKKEDKDEKKHEKDN